MTVLRLATRRSPLALRQATYVQEKLREIGVECVMVHIETHGDLHLDASLDAMGGQGVFALEVQKALIDGVADVAVHSAKDLPSITPNELALVCVPERRDAADVLVGRSLAGLGPGATVATGSPRRRALLLERRPDLRIVGLRGNMATRLDVARRPGVDAIVAAAAALERLDEVDRVSERLDTEWFVPQVGQGALALEARVHDPDTHQALLAINDDNALRAVHAERAFLRELGAGCSIPAGAFATISDGIITLRGVMLAVDGSRSVRATHVGVEPMDLGRDLALQLRDTMHGDELVGWDVAR